MNDTLSQGYALCAFVYAGILIGVVYDCARLVRLTTQKQLVRHLSDALFILVFAALAFRAFFLVTGGAPRLYGFICMALGAAFQQWAFGRWICKRIVKRKH